MKTVLEFIKPLRSVFDTNSDGILVTSRSGKIVYCNPFLSKNVKMTPASLIGKSCFYLFSDLDTLEIDKKLYKRFSYTSRISLKTLKSASLLEFNVTAYHLGSSDNPIGILFIFQSIGSSTENELFSTKKHSILKVMDNRADTGWIVSDVQTGKNHFISQGMEILTGWTKEDFLKGGWGFGLSNIHEDDVAKIMVDFQENLEKRNNQPFVHDHFSWETIFRYKKKNKGYIRVKCITSVLERDANQQVKFLIASFSLQSKNLSEVEKNRQDNNHEDSIRMIDGKPYIHLGFLQSLRENKNLSAKKEETPELSEWELEVLFLMSEGLSSEKIADRLHVSAHTVKTHRKMLLKKLDAKNSAELIRKAEKLGLF